MSNRTILAALMVACVSASGALAAGASASPVTLNGTVGPSPTISLAKAGAKVKTLKPGAYRLVVDDRSPNHDFHLVGPGVNVTTTVPWTGSKTFSITLKKGTYRYYCDPHRSFMNGSFTVS
jgi:plastocyanin